MFSQRESPEDSLNPEDSLKCVPLSTQNLILTLILTVAVLLTVVLANGLVILLFFKYRSLRTHQNVYFLSLAAVGLLVGLFILPLNLQNQIRGCWTLGKSMCKLYVTMDFILCTMTILHLVAIAVDRYRILQAGGKHVEPRSFKKALGIIATLFILALWISSPPVLGWDPKWLEKKKNTSTSTGSDIFKCIYMERVGYILYSTFGGVALPTVLMLSFYWKIHYALKERLEKKSGGRGSGTEDDSSGNGTENERSSAPAPAVVPPAAPTTSVDIIDPLRLKCITWSRKSSTLVARQSYFKYFLKGKQRFSLRKEKEAVRMLGVMLAAFCICWLPFCLINVFVPILHQQYGLPLPPEGVLVFFNWLGYFNSGLNPIIYFVFHSKFKAALKKLLHIETF